MRTPRSDEDLKRNFLSAIRAAKILGIGSHDTMGNLIREGYLTPIRVKGRIYFYRDNVFRVRRNIEARELIHIRKHRMNLNIYKKKARGRANLVAMKKRNLTKQTCAGDIEWAIDFITGGKITW